MEYNEEFQGVQRESFVFYASFQEVMEEELTEQEQYVLYRAIAKYALYGEMPNFESGDGINERMVRACWKLIVPQLDANWRRFLNGNKGKEYGKQGGNPNFKKGQTNPYKPKSKPDNNPKNNPKDNPDNNPKTATEPQAKSAVPKGCSKFDFSFVDERFKEAFFKWLQYKYEIDGRKFYKSQATIEVVYKYLCEKSGNNEHEALQIVEQSIANGWSGLFELNKKQNGNNRTSNKPTAADNIAAAQQEQLRNVAATLVGEAESKH